MEPREITKNDQDIYLHVYCSWLSCASSLVFGLPGAATVRPMSIPDPARSRWRHALREVGLKCTEQRLAVLDELDSADAPVSHREMLDRLAHFQWDPATTFRNLNDLCERGLVTRFDLGDHIWRFELRKPAADTESRHPHFVCVACGAITCLHDISVATAARRLRVPSQVQSVDEVLFKGRCKDCVSGFH